MLEFILAFSSGLLSILSPCVLPMLPIIIASSMQTAPRYILMLPLGLATCFSLLGVGSNFLLNAFGIASFELQKVAAVIFIIIGLLLIFSALGTYFQQKTQNLLQGLMDAAQKNIDRLNLQSPWGQFLLGFLLAMTWTPCIGPTLGVALSLAASGENLLNAGVMMFLYSLGISLPFVAFIYALKYQQRQQSSHPNTKPSVLKNMTQKLQKFSQHFKIAFGILILLWGVMVFMGWDKLLSSELIRFTDNISFLKAK